MQQPPAQAPAWPPTADSAAAVAAAYLELVRAGLPGALAAYLNDKTHDSSDRPLTAAQAADLLAAFREYFGHSALQLRRVDSYVDDPRIYYQYRFVVGADPRRELQLVVSYRDDEYTPRLPRLRDPLLLHAPYLREYVGRYIELLQAGDATALARFMTADDVDYPVAAAQALIDRYRAEADLSTLAYAYGGYRQGHGFTVYVSGRTTAGGLLEHTMVVNFGDGLVWIEDPWDAQQPPAAPAPAWPPGPAAAEREAAAYLALLQAGDPVALAGYLTEHAGTRGARPVTAEQASLVLDAYRAYFGAAALRAGLEPSHTRPPYADGHFVFAITATGRPDRTGTVWIDCSEPEQSPRVSNPIVPLMLGVLPKAQAFADRYVALLQAGDVDRLDGFMAADDKPYPAGGAQTLLDRYRAETRLDTLTSSYASYLGPGLPASSSPGRTPPASPCATT